MKVDHILPPDLAEIREAHLRAELAAKDLQVLKLRAFVRYELRDGDSFDMATGAISRAVDAVPVDG